MFYNIIGYHIHIYISEQFRSTLTTINKQVRYSLCLYSFIYSLYHITKMLICL